MSKYTTELRYIIESGFDLGLKDYPLHTFKNYEGDYRKQLNDKIIEHYSFREIGLETPALFKRFFNRKMNEIMPYYNQMYASQDIVFNPLWNVEIHETYSHTINDDGKTTKAITQDGTGTSKNDIINSETGKNTTVGNATENGTSLNDGTSSSNTDTTDDNTHTDTTTLTNTSTDTDRRTVTEKGTVGDKVTNNDETTIVNQDTPQSEITPDDIRLNKYASSIVHNVVDNIKDNLSTKDNLITNGGNVEKESLSTSVNNIVDEGKGTNNNVGVTHNLNSTTGIGTINNVVDNSINGTVGNTGSLTSNLKSNDETNANNLRTETFTRLEEGSSAGLPYSNAIKQWRQIMVNIDMLIIEELESLFMQIW